MYPCYSRNQKNRQMDFVDTNVPRNYGTQIQNPHISSYRFSITDSLGN